MLVPDNFSFSLQDVANVTGYSNLSDSFTYYNSSWVDSYYWNYEAGIRRFRNYGPKDNFDLDQYILYFDSWGSSCNTNTINVSTNLNWYTSVDTSEINFYIYPGSGSGNASIYVSIESANWDGWEHAGQITFYDSYTDAWLGSVAILQHSYGQGCY